MFIKMDNAKEKTNQEMSGGEETVEGGMMMIKLKSFVHEHPLLDDGISNGEICNECGVYIFGPAYICRTCKFYIHKACVELPSQIYHPLHPKHPLILSPPPCPPSLNGIFLCEMCYFPRDGYSFYCADCHYALDSHCALSIPTVIQHLSHQHPLTLYSETPRCSVCRTWCETACFKCTKPKCRHILDFGCALLPATGKHKAHRHQLSLTYLPRDENRDNNENDDVDDDDDNDNDNDNDNDGNDDDENYCDACETQRGSHGLLYCCQKCDFVAHTSCICTSPSQQIPSVKSSLLTFKDQSHDHILTLPPLSYDRTSDGRMLKCGGCLPPNWCWPFYRCGDCSYNIGIRCASKTPGKRLSEQKDRGNSEVGDKVQKIESHQHSLTFSDVPCNNERCYVCRLPISGENYNCSDCKVFLHKLCRKLPSEISKPEIHRGHPLVLAQPPSPLYLNNMFVCEVCSSPGDGFSYHCPDCKSVFHVHCALNIPSILEHKLHEDSFFLTMDNTRPCYACGNDINGAAYSCTESDLALDLQCAFLPTTENHESHPHPLKLISQVLDIFCCSICGQEREWKGWAYCCEDCKFIAHTNCICKKDPSPLLQLGGTLKQQSHEHLLTLILGTEETQCSHCDKPLFRGDLAYQCLECNYNLDVGCASRLMYAKPLGWIQDEDGEVHHSGAISGGSEMASEVVEHFSHHHPLALLDEQPGDNKRCNGCRLAISSPTYCCKDCNFFLHKSCLELPHKIMFPLHPKHPLKLSKDHPFPFKNGIFYCDFCRTPGEGLSYSCAEGCWIISHVHCALHTPMEIRHASHEHMLTLQMSSGPPCAACQKNIEGAAFFCSRCFFILHVKCALQRLPTSVKLRAHRHELTLLYHHTKDESDVLDDFYCDACEEKRDAKTWVYGCVECEFLFLAHTDCRKPDPFPYIELGGIHKIGIHDHPLTLDFRSDAVHLPFEERIVRELIFRCTECNYEVDLLLSIFPDRRRR